MRAPKGESKGFEKHPAGWTTAVCSRIIDIGTHWNDKKQSFQRKIMIGFESAKLIQEGEFKGEPFLLFANFNYSMYQNAHLCKFVEDWNAKRFASQDEADAYDLAQLLNKPAFVNVVHSDDGKYVNIQTIGPVPAEMTAPTVKGKTILIDQDALDKSEVDKLSDKMKERVMSAKERTEGEQYEAQARMDNASEQENTMMNGSTSATPPSTATTNSGGNFDERNPPPGFDDDIPF